MKEVLSAFDDIVNKLSDLGVKMNLAPDWVRDRVCDIHLSAGSALSFICFDGSLYTAGSEVLSTEDIRILFRKLCDYSLYRHIDEIEKGYITLFGRYRCGIAGTAVRHGSGAASIRNITSLNIRVPRYVPGAAEKLSTCKDKLLYGVLVVGEPSSGKTTVLRDIISGLSNCRCVVADEKRELTGGFPVSGVDILLEYSKSEAISRAIRNLSPRFIVCDEIGTDDIPAIKNSVSAGVALIASVHGQALDGQILRRDVVELLGTGAFGTVAVLKGREKPGEIKVVTDYNDFLESYGGVADSIVRPIHGA